MCSNLHAKVITHTFDILRKAFSSQLSKRNQILNPEINRRFACSMAIVTNQKIKQTHFSYIYRVAQINPEILELLHVFLAMTLSEYVYILLSCYKNQRNRMFGSQYVF